MDGSITIGNRVDATAADYSLALWCDNGTSYTIHSSLLALGVGSAKTDLAFSADLPLDRVGHTCTLSALESHDRPIVFQAPRYGNNKGKTTSILYGSVVYRTNTGGL